MALGPATGAVPSLTALCARFPNVPAPLLSQVIPAAIIYQSTTFAMLPKQLWGALTWDNFFTEALNNFTAQMLTAVLLAEVKAASPDFRTDIATQMGAHGVPLLSDENTCYTWHAALSALGPTYNNIPNPFNATNWAARTDGGSLQLPGTTSTSLGFSSYADAWKATNDFNNQSGFGALVSGLGADVAGVIDAAGGLLGGSGNFVGQLLDAAANFESSQAYAIGNDPLNAAEQIAAGIPGVYLDYITGGAFLLAGEAGLVVAALGVLTGNPSWGTAYFNALAVTAIVPATDPAGSLEVIAGAAGEELGIAGAQKVLQAGVTDLASKTIAAIAGGGGVSSLSGPTGQPQQSVFKAVTDTEDSPTLVQTGLSTLDVVVGICVCVAAYLAVAK